MECPECGAEMVQDSERVYIPEFDFDKMEVRNGAYWNCLSCGNKFLEDNIYELTLKLGRLFKKIS